MTLANMLGEDEFNWVGIFEVGVPVTHFESKHRMHLLAGNTHHRDMLEFVWAEPDEFNLIKVYYRYFKIDRESHKVRSDTIFVEDNANMPMEPFEMSLYIEMQIRAVIIKNDKREDFYE